MPRFHRDSAKPKALSQASVSLMMMDDFTPYGSVSAFNKNQQFRMKLGCKMLVCRCNLPLSQICNEGAFQLDSIGRMLPLCVGVSNG